MVPSYPLFRSLKLGKNDNAIGCAGDAEMILYRRAGFMSIGMNLRWLAYHTSALSF